jgi:predicted alpha/beta hydrolase
MDALRQCSLTALRPPRAQADSGAAGVAFTLAGGAGVPIAARRFGAVAAQAAIVIAPATGVPQGLYRAFAAWAAAQGVAAYTFDFRGVAASRPHRLRGFRASFADWASDIDAVLGHALAQHPRVSLLGHSIGGFLGPVAQHAPRLHRLVLVGAQTAHWRDWPATQRWPMAALWHGLMPALTLAVGYFPGRALRLGEDLPRGVALEWASRPWRDPFTHPSGAVVQARYARMLPPVLLGAATDDVFATPAALDRVAARLQGPLTRERWAPASVGQQRLGHFDVFRPRAAALWPRWLTFLQGEGS